ncbi:MAG: pyruvate kinase [Candidatus Cloacimonetes bacterium HGW-Cloacimonetes-3]|nr:MAG: pyruvate kinase [Candidatus Cloacimonetes bacterium HGW-Cloacimonetes-3]
MSMKTNKTKLVCTIGPASETPEMMYQMIVAGLDIARLNYSHGDFAYHAKSITNLRNAAKKAGRSITILADLPGPKIRLGKLKEESYTLEVDDIITLSSRQFIGDKTRVSVTLPSLPQAVHPDDVMFLNDGLIQLIVLQTDKTEIQCRVLVGGEIRSNKGMNLPSINLGICAFTKRDHECLKSALENGVDAISQSFVDEAADVVAVRKAAAELGYKPFIVAKIERADALVKLDEILNEADGIMIARGDLGVEIPIEELAIVQKRLIARANLFGKPVITATQMLESMVDNPRPTRAEATDVANAVLDGTDCIMLSEESAIGNYPLEAVKMLVKIAAATEPHIGTINNNKRVSDFYRPDAAHITDVVSHNVYQTVTHLMPAILLAHTVSGHTARMISRFKLPVWVTAVSMDYQTCQNLQFSWGVKAVCLEGMPQDWKAFIRGKLQFDDTNKYAVIVEVPSTSNPNANHRLEILEL